MNYGFQPNLASVMILNCSRDCIPITYLEVPLTGRRLRRQDWSNLIGLIQSRLTSWTAIYLSLGGRLTLINPVLSTIPIYWMSVFKLVILEIDKIRRDFLWKGPDMGSKGIRLVAWKRICRPKNLGGWGIINLKEFNRALLGKWWWKIATNPISCWAKIINTNYNTLILIFLALCFIQRPEINLSSGQEFMTPYPLFVYAFPNLLITDPTLFGLTNGTMDTR